MALTVSNTFRHKQRVILTEITLVLSGLIFMTIMTTRDAANYTYGELLFSILRFDVNFATERNERIDRLEQIALGEPGVKAVEAWDLKSATLRRAGQPEASNDQRAVVFGVPLPTDLYGPQMVGGRWLRPGDGDVVVLNQKLAADAGVGIGDRITLKIGLDHESDWVVVGLLFDPIVTVSAHVPLAAMGRATHALNRASTVWIQAQNPQRESVLELARRLRGVYTDERVRLQAGSVFGKDTAVEIIDGIMAQFAVIITLLATIAVLIGVVGSLALSGVLSLNVLERRREIGVLRAIGASSAAVGGQFIGEGLILGWLSWLIAWPLRIPAGQLMVSGLSSALGSQMVYRYTPVGPRSGWGSSPCWPSSPAGCRRALPAASARARAWRMSRGRNHMLHHWQRPLILLICGLLLAAPRVALAQANTDPLPPLNAWERDADGNLYVLDAGQRIFSLNPASSTQQPVSYPLAYGFSDSNAQIAADSDRLYVRSDHFDGIKILMRETLVEVETISINAAAVAVEPGQRLFVIERRPAPQMEGLYTFSVVTLPLDDLGAEPQEFGVTASQPYGSLYDLVVDAPQGLLYIGYLDTGGSPNRHYRTYRAYDLESGEEVDMGLPHEPASTALRPALTEDGTAAVSYRWEGVYPVQERIYLLDRGQEPTTVEHVSGPLTIDAAGQWLYVARERGLWILERDDKSGFSLRMVMPFLQQPPADVRLSSDGATLYLLGNGWLTPFVAAWLQQGRGGVSFGPLPSFWTSAANPDAQTPRLFAAADGDTAAAGDVAFLNLQPSNEWYLSNDDGGNWALLVSVQYPQPLGLDRLSLSPSMAEDEVAVARGGWQDGRRTIRRAEDVQAVWAAWAEWTPPIAYVAGAEGARTLYVLGEDGEPQPVPIGGSTENPAWSPGWTHLAFQNNITGDWELYRVPADCRGAAEGPSAAAQECDVQQLTDSASDDLLPAWSPDGRYIAFVSLRDGDPEIYVMLADGSQQTRLTFAPGGDWRPAWLPDSRHLVFTSDRNGSNDIFLLQLPLTLGGENTREPSVTPVVAGPADERDPAVSGDGELLYLSDQDSVMQPYVAGLNSFLASSSRTPITGSPALQDVEEPIGHPGWLPDGNLLFTAGGGIYSASRYAGPEDWREVAAPEAEALHPAAGATWYWPEP